jgi:hypothetical protein
VHAVLGRDHVVVVVEADVELDPLHLAAEPALPVIGRHGGVVLVAGVRRLVGGEEEGLGLLDAAVTGRLAVDVRDSSRR